MLNIDDTCAIYVWRPCVGTSAVAIWDDSVEYGYFTINALFGNVLIASGVIGLPVITQSLAIFSDMYIA